MGINDYIIDGYLQNYIDVNRYYLSVKKEILKILDSLEASIGELIVDIDPNKYENVYRKRKRIKELSKKINYLIDKDYERILQQIDLYDFAKVQANLLGVLLSSRLSSKIKLHPISDNEIKSTINNLKLSNKNIHVWGYQQANSLKKVIDKNIKNTVGGLTTEDLISKLSGIGKNRSVFDNIKYRAISLAQTSIYTIANKMTFDLFKKNKDLIIKYQHISVLDLKTTFVCSARNGLLWDNDFNPLGHELKFEEPPLHWNCRSFMVGIIGRYKDLSQDFTEQFSDNFNELFDGNIPEQIDIEVFFKKKSKTVQDDILGKERAEMWRNDKIKFVDLIDSNNRVLTIDELKRK